MTDNLLKEYSLILFKPDAYERNLTEIIMQEFSNANLEVVYHKKIRLIEKMLRKYQPLLNEPDDFGETAWQYDIINAYTKETTDVFLFQGVDAIKKTNKIKQDIRNKYITGENKYIIYNLLHSVDDFADLKLNMSALMPEKLYLIEKDEKYETTD